MKICNLLQSTQDVTYPTLASSQETVYQDLFPTDRDTCPRRQEKIPETTATQGPPFIPATDPESIRSQTHQTLQIEQDYDSHEITPNQQKQSIRVRGTPVKAACLACRKRKSKCNGDRPSCKLCIARATDCGYTVDAGLSQRQAMNQRLEAYKYVLDLLRQGSVTECRTLLLSLKSHGSVAEAVESINRDRWTREDGEGAGVIWFEQ
ncbi:hypothetical protein D6D06_09565 [Aureobasidium pullulans]|nr:hypothetical protein D6D06_09565 [Aureobasidium pullulans]